MFDQNQCQLFISIAIVTQQLVGHKIICIMKSLNIYDVNIISLNTCSQIELFPLTI